MALIDSSIYQKDHMSLLSIATINTPTRFLDTPARFLDTTARNPKVGAKSVSDPKINSNPTNTDAKTHTEKRKKALT